MIDPRSRTVWCIAFVGVFATVPVSQAAEPVAFNRDIRPILSDNCYACHGPDRNQRKANLRLDNDTDAFTDRDGTRIVVAGKPEASELFRKLTAPDPKKRMPPPKFGKALSAQQVELIRHWIDKASLSSTVADCRRCRCLASSAATGRSIQ